MSGDYTRFTFDPAKGYSGVHKQQGRVSLDADFNEFEEILDRRQRATTLDIVGQAVVPETTPEGFEITASAAGQLTIGPGRAYVDGILVECFGDMDDPLATEHDATLGGVRSTDPVAYDAQPFYYQPEYPALSANANAINLVYLDVWQREVTVFEDGDLREPALGGPDTATRVQTAWQVKVLPDVNVASCGADIPAWDALIAPSTARLTVGTKPVPLAPGPCIVNPAGGYIGVENRLYRVEVQRAGTLGGAGDARAQFTWSRDNASIVATVTAIAAEAPGRTALTVEQIGPDQMRRFAKDQWLELLDDDFELARRESGHGGHIVKVFEVRPATGQIVIEAAPAAVPVNLKRHARIIRWDQARVGDPVVHNVNDGTPIDLEDGITITFGGAATDTLHAGDSWVFPARTVEGTAGPLVNAPPRGILHHYARLALIQTGVAGQGDDCRVFWPPAGEGCCSAVVFPGDSIQEAIDLLDETGGCVCLKAGVHEIEGPLVIRRGDLTLKGEAPWVTVRLTTDGTQMLRIELPDNGRNVSVTGILFEAPAKEAEAMVAVRGLTGGAITDCAFLAGGPAPEPGPDTTGIALNDSADLTIVDNFLRGFARGITGEGSTQVSVLDNSLEGPTLAGGEQAVSLGAMGIAFAAGGPGPRGIRIEFNDLTHYRRGVQLGDQSRGILTHVPARALQDDVAEAGCRIVGNVVRRAGDPEEAGVEFTGVSAAIMSLVVRCEIVENAVAIACLTDAGILAAGANTLVARNEVHSHAPLSVDDDTPLPKGVAFAQVADSLACTIRENRFTGVQQAILVAGRGGSEAGQAAGRIDVMANRIAGSAELLREVVPYFDAKPDTFNPTHLDAFRQYGAIVVTNLPARIAGNEIQDVYGGIVCTGGVTSVVSNRITTGAVGAVIVGNPDMPAEAGVLDNAIEGMSMAGIITTQADRAMVARNTIANAALGIFSTLSTGVRIHHNQVRQGMVGIDCYQERDPVIHGNTVEDATTAGIRTIACLQEVTLSDNHATRCGYRGEDDADDLPAYGIYALDTWGTVSVNGCHIVDTGEAALAERPLFKGARRGLAVEWAGGVRAHANVVMSRPLRSAEGTQMPHPGSRALALIAFPDREIEGSQEVPPFADASDNHLEQAVGVLVEILSGRLERIDDETISGNGEILFAGNRCLNTAPELESDDLATVDLTAANVTVTGNQIRNIPRWNALRVLAATVSATGNSISGGRDITTMTEAPAPFQDHNIEIH